MIGGEEKPQLAGPGIEAIKRELQSAGIEVYRVRENVIEIAERVRFHIMDSGIRVVAQVPIEVRFSARSQKSGNPDLDDDALFGLVRDALSGAASEQGFVEEGTSSQRVTDPSDPNRVLDVWYEVRFVRHVTDPAEVAGLVRWILTVERFIGSSAPPDGDAY